MGTATSKRGPTALHHVKGGHPSIVTQVDNGAISILRDRAGLGFGLALGETLISNGALIWEVQSVITVITHNDCPIRKDDDTMWIVKLIRSASSTANGL